MSTLADQLRKILIFINRYCLIPIFVFGIIGNILNVIYIVIVFIIKWLPLFFSIYQIQFIHYILCSMFKKK